VIACSAASRSSGQLFVLIPAFTFSVDVVRRVVKTPHDFQKRVRDVSPQEMSHLLTLGLLDSSGSGKNNDSLVK